MAESKKCIVKFKYKYNGSKNDEVGVVGNLDELKNWDNNNPVNLYYSEKDGMFLSNELSIPHNITFEYKYVFFTNNEHKWEELPFNMNRKIEIKNEPSLTFIDIQGKEKTEIEKKEREKTEKENTKKKKSEEPPKKSKIIKKKKNKKEDFESKKEDLEDEKKKTSGIKQSNNKKEEDFKEEKKK